MPDDGAWLNTSHASLRGAGDTRTARARFEEVLAEFTQRLGSPEPMRRETAVALVQQMQRLATLMSIDQDASDGRAMDLSTALTALNARLDSEVAAAAAREAQLTARLDRTLAELADARDSKRPLFGAGAVRLVLAAAALCAVLCGTAVGLTVSKRPQAAEPPAPAAAVATVVADDVPSREDPVPVPTPAEPVHVEIAAQVPAVSTTSRTSDTFAMVSAALARGEPTAVRRLNALAQAGDPRAQMQLASFYESGASGLVRDLVAARRWTLRAARGGDRAAMYNTAIFLMEGEGGPQDMPEAAVWFRRAAERGVTDAQYNLGVMYESGRGVEKNAAEAKRWFALAAKAGDATAAGKLSGAEPAPATIVAADDGPSVAETQRYLAQQGYYIGAIDGAVSPELAAAAKAYVRDHPGSTPGR